jgi:DNA-binding protein H-NS
MSDDLQYIEQQIADLQKRKKLLLGSQRVSVLKDVKNSIRIFSFTASELGLGNGGNASSHISVKAKAKYANPANPSQTWHGGKGPKPKWIIAFLADGGNLQDILINK